MRKIGVFVLGMFGGLILIVLLAGWWLGAFNSAKVTREPRGPYRILCVAHTGPYARIGDAMTEVQRRMTAALQQAAPNDPADRWFADHLGAPCALYLDAPAKSPDPSKLRSRGGFLVTSDISADVLKAANAPPNNTPPLEIVEIPKRDAAVARFDGHPSIAPFKTYPAIAKWMKANNVTGAGPSLELYRGRSVETEMPIAPAPK